MPYTHDYELQIGETTFSGELELSNAGVVAFHETSEDKMSSRIEGQFKALLEDLSKTYTEYNDLIKLEVTKKP